MGIGERGGEEGREGSLSLLVGMSGRGPFVTTTTTTTTTTMISLTMIPERPQSPKCQLVMVLQKP